MEILISSHIHDEARVVSAKYELTLRSPDDAEHACADFCEGLKSINKWAAENSILIGHSKGFISTQAASVTFSTVGDAVDLKGSLEEISFPACTEVGITLILFGCELHSVEEQMAKLCERILAQFSISPRFVYKGDEGHICDENCTHDHGHTHGHG